MKKVYVGCSLYDASPEFRQSIQEFKESLHSDFEVLEFIGAGTDTSAEQIVRHDLAQVRKSDIIVAVCDQPSLGLGIEIGTANAMQKPILCCSKSENISQMVIGNHAENPNSSHYVYRDFEDLKTELIRFTTQFL